MITRWLLPILLIVFSFSASAARVSDTGWHAAGLIAGHTVHRDSDVNFNALEFHGYYTLPWEWEPFWGFRVGTHMSSSIGTIFGEDDATATLSTGPHLRFFRSDRGFYVEFGTRATLFTETKVGRKNFGGPFQFGSFISLGHPITQNYDLSIRMQHYSNAGIYKNNRGIDLGMIEIRRRF